MLYITTRNNLDTYTAHRAVTEARGPDGGIFVPYKIVTFSEEELLSLGTISFNQRLAQVLGRLLGIRSSGWDLDLYIGRYPVRLNKMSHRIAIAETWHNSDGNFHRLVENIGKILPTETECCTPWLEMSVRIAVLFAVFGELLSKGLLEADTRFDISLISGDFFGPMSAWYAREMGLPVENIVCCCNENSSLWNLIYHGEFRTDQVCINTGIPEADVTVPDGLECLVSACCGTQETQRYLETVRLGRMYCATDYFERLRRGFHVSVISEPAVLRTIPNVFSTSGAVLSSAAALAYAGLLDYRARTGESRLGLVLADRGPETDIDNLAKAFHVSSREMQDWLNRI